MLFAEKSKRRPIDNVLMTASIIGLFQLGATIFVASYILTSYIMNYRSDDEWITIPPSVY